MINDTIVEEIHQIRAQLLAQHGGDFAAYFAAYFAALLQKQQQHPERYTSFAQATGAPLPAASKPLAPPAH
jgi:hypothetical protein